MPSHAARTLLALALVLLPATGAAAQAPPARPGTADVEAAAQSEADLLALPSAEGWVALLERDRSLTFTARTPTEARAALAQAEVSPERRAAAILALGAASDEGERTRLEDLARTGTGIERLAAILGLGEMNAGATSILAAIAEGERGVAQECALLALLRDGRNAGRRRVEEVAADPAHPAAEAARELLVFAFDSKASRPTRAAAALLRLRWDAAREYGLVQGQAWKVLAVRALASDPELVADVVLGAQATARRPGVTDHLLQTVLKGRGLGRLRAAVAIMPRELSDLVENGLWQPADLSEWRAVLEEIRDRRVERIADGVVERALDVPELRFEALELAGLAGIDVGTVLLAVDASELDAPLRAALAFALGAADDPAWLQRFTALREDPDATVRAAFRVAALRHDQKKARAEVEERALDATHPEHDVQIAALLPAARDPFAAAVLETRLTEARGRSRLTIASALCKAGRVAGRSVVRKTLSSDAPPRGAAAAVLVRALAAGGTSEDAELFRALFPRPDDRELDAELARVLAQLGDRVVEPILRVALWEAEFDVSVLAAGTLQDQGGPFAILRELANPPVDAASSDLRRVGFAVGTWGGLPGFERLQRELRATSAHPAIQGAWLGAMASRTR